MTTPSQNTEDSYTWCERCEGRTNTSNRIDGSYLCDACYEDALMEETSDEIDTLVAT